MCPPDIAFGGCRRSGSVSSAAPPPRPPPPEDGGGDGASGPGRIDGWPFDDAVGGRIAHHLARVDPAAVLALGVTSRACRRAAVAGSGPVAAIMVDVLRLGSATRRRTLLRAGLGACPTRSPLAAALGHFSTLDLRGCSLTPAELDRLGDACPRLLRLVLDGDAIVPARADARPPRSTGQAHPADAHADAAVPAWARRLAVLDWEDCGARAAAARWPPLQSLTGMVGLTRLTVVCATGHSQPMGWLADLASLRRLRALQLTHLDVAHDPGAMAQLGRLTGLTELTLACLALPRPAAAATTRTLQPLTALRRLSRLALPRTRRLRAPDVGLLAQLPALRQLDLSGCDLDDAGRAAAASLTALAALNLADPCGTAQDETLDLTAMGHLTALDLSGQYDLADADLRVALAGLSRLQSLRLGGCGTGEEGVDFLADLRALTRLDLGGGYPLLLDELPILARLHRLQALEVTIAVHQCEGLGPLTALRRLTSLGITVHLSAGWDPVGLPDLAEFTRLRRLALTLPVPSGAEALQPLQAMPHLRDLTLADRVDLRGPDAAHVRRCAQLRSLRLEGMDGLDPAQLLALAPLPGLTALTTVRCPATATLGPATAAATFPALHLLSQDDGAPLRPRLHALTVRVAAAQRRATPAGRTSLT